MITIEAASPTSLATAIQERFQIPADVIENTVRLEQADGQGWMTRILQAFPQQVLAIRWGKPTLEDVFIQRTGHRFWQATDSPESPLERGPKP